MTGAKTATKTIFPIAGWSEARLEQITIDERADPVLPTPYRITETAAATQAAVGLAAADIWELRGGNQQPVCVNARHATAALRSGRYLQLNGKPVPNDQHPLMDIYPARDGEWVYLHCNFPNHRAAALKVLGVADDYDAVAKAVTTWDATALEEAIILARGAGGRVRSHAQWAEHPQASAVASLPLMEIIKIGEASPEPLARGDRPLSGVRVLDLTRVLAGPTCARTLAEHGADVLKINGPHLPTIGHQEYDTSHGKLSAYLDLRDQGDLHTLKNLIKTGDIFSQGYRPGTLARRGLSPELLAELRPGIICVSLSAFSHIGPWSERRGFDTVIQSVSGIAHRQGTLFEGPRPGPKFYPVSAIDYLTGNLMAFGALVALGRRTREGGSWHVRISLAQVGHWLATRGQIAAADLTNVPTEFEPDEIERWSIVTNTPMGRLHHLAPVVQLPETPPQWERPSVPVGFHAPAWPSRD